MNEWIEFAKFLLFLGISEAIYIWVVMKINKKKKTKLQKNCALWCDYTKTHKQYAKKRDDYFCGEVAKFLEGRTHEEIIHGKSMLEAELSAYSIWAILFAILQVLLIAFCKTIVNYFLYGLVKISDPNYSVTADIMSDSMQIIFLILFIMIIYPIVNEYKAEKYFLEMINIFMQEKERKADNSKIEELEKRITQLSEDVSLLKKENKDIKGCICAVNYSKIHQMENDIQIIRERVMQSKGKSFWERVSHLIKE